MRNLSLKAGLAATLLAISLTGALAGGDTYVEKLRDAREPQQVPMTTSVITIEPSRSFDAALQSNSNASQALHWHEGYAD